MKVVNGRWPAATPVPPAVAGTGNPGRTSPAATLQVAMTRQTAATLGLHAGSTFVITGPQLASTGVATPITVLVTGIVIPVDPDSSFWGVDPAILAPARQRQGATGGRYWAGAVLVGPDETDELQSYFSSGNLRMEWVLPQDVSSFDGQQVQPLSDALSQIGTQVPALSGPLQPVHYGPGRGTTGGGWWPSRCYPPSSRRR
jgi:hypothetical protein